MPHSRNCETYSLLLFIVKTKIVVFLTETTFLLNIFYLYLKSSLQMSRLDKERQLEIQPARMEFAVNSITKIGYKITILNDNEINFSFEGHLIKFFPYSGWHTGRSIKDGRGIAKLLKQIKKP